MHSTTTTPDEHTEKIRIRVKTLNNNTFDFDDVDVNATVLEFQSMVKEKTGIQETRQRIIYRGKMLKSTDKISTYKIQNGHTLHLCARPLEATPSDRSYEDREARARNRRRELFSSLLTSGQMGGNNGGMRPLILSNQVAAQIGRNAPVSGGSNQTGEQNGSNARGAFARPQTARMEHVWQGLLTLNTLMSTMSIASSTEIEPDWQDAPSVPPFNEDNDDEMNEEEKKEDEEEVIEWKRKFFVGQWLDVKDTVNQWLEATILRISDTRLYVTYNGWPSRWDEWIEHTSDRIAPFRTKTLHASTSPHMSPSPVSWIANAPATGPNDVRPLISSVTNMVERTMPMIERFNQLCFSCSQAGEQKDEEEEKTEDSWRNNDRLQAYATELAPILDRLGRIVSDLAPQIAQLNRRHVPPSTQQQQEEQQNTIVHNTADENNSATTTTTTTTNEAEESTQQQDENVEDTFTQLISTTSNSPHLARRQGNVDIHIHAILTPFGQQQSNNGNVPTSSVTTLTSNNQGTNQQNNVSTLFSGSRLHQERMQPVYQSTTAMPMPFGPTLRPSNGEGSTSTGTMSTPPTTTTTASTTYPSHHQQQSAIRDRFGDSLVSMIRRYRGVRSLGSADDSSGDGGNGVTSSSAPTRPINSADALSAALNNSIERNRNDTDRNAGSSSSNGNDNDERPSACSQQID